MELTVDFGNPVFDEQAAWAITPEDLDKFYCSAGEVDQLNLFFQLEASFRRHLEAGRAELAAHLAFLTAYYLFTPLTPPASWSWQRTISGRRCGCTRPRSTGSGAPSSKKGIRTCEYKILVKHRIRTWKDNHHD